MANLNKRNLTEMSVAGKRVIVRVDFNVPRDKKSNEITDDNRIRKALPTIEYLVEERAKVILVSHLGRPKGFDEKLSMAVVAKRLSELLGKEVILAKDVIGDDAKAKAAALKDGEVMLLENVRYHGEETKNNRAFAKELAGLAELYVNDAFGTAHRAHTSTYGLSRFLPSAAGFLIQKEMEIMGGALANPKRPFTAILGGAKVSDKIGVIENLIDKVDNLIIGGAMAYTFFAAQGYTIGTSLFEADKVELARELLAKAEEKGVNLLLPVDTVVASEFAADADYKTVPSDAIPADMMGMDIGAETAAAYAEVVKNSGTVVWNGPMGVFEFDNFAVGTRSVAAAIADSAAISIIGGGDSAAAVQKLGFAGKVTHISTGGGASLELLEGKILPGLAGLGDKNPRRLMAAGNWKMNKGLPAEAAALIGELLKTTVDTASEVVLAPPYTALAAAVAATQYKHIEIAAQNGHIAEKGAYTGEIAMKMLAEMGVEYCIVGHSERREYFHETNADVNAKIKAALDWGVFPILCVGETLEQREAGETFDVLKKQVAECLAGVHAEDFFRIVIAYEPIWAIGTGRTATAEQADEACGFIRSEIAGHYSEADAAKIRILYGGSVKPANCLEIFSQPNVDGGLVGGASLKAEDFAVIANTEK